MISFDLRLACPVLYLMLAACEGDGSDIGPKLDTLPNASSKVLVLDDTGRGVAGASVAVVGVDVPDFARVTGRSGRAALHDRSCATRSASPSNEAPQPRVQRSLPSASTAPPS